MPRKNSSVLLILPTDDTFISLRRLQPALEDDYGVSLKQLTEIVIETWADIRGLRRAGYIYYPTECVGFDPVYALQCRLDDDILAPQAMEPVSDEEFDRTIEVLTNLCLIIYFAIDAYLSYLRLPDDGTVALDRLQWLDDDVVVNLYMPDE